MDFKEKKEYVKKNKKIDIKHFDSVKEVTNMIDFLNKEKEDEVNKRADEEISSITRFLADSSMRKIFFLGRKK